MIILTRVLPLVLLATILGTSPGLAESHNKKQCNAPQELVKSAKKAFNKPDCGGVPTNILNTAVCNIQSELRSKHKGKASQKKVTATVLAACNDYLQGNLSSSPSLTSNPTSDSTSSWDGPETLSADGAPITLAGSGGSEDGGGSGACTGPLPALPCDGIPVVCTTTSGQEVQFGCFADAVRSSERCHLKNCHRKSTGSDPGQGGGGGGTTTPPDGNGGEPTTIGDDSEQCYPHQLNCSLDYKPVCCWNLNPETPHVTYPNFCTAKEQCQDICIQGACEDKNGSGGVDCPGKGNACYELWDPVCATIDGVHFTTFSNNCFANAACAKIIRKGQC